MLILASASLARRRLLEQAAIPHRVMVSDIDERTIHHSDPKQLVQLLAQAKAQSVSKKLFSDGVADAFDCHQVNAVLGCDSLFEFQGEIFGKPCNQDEAVSRWARMSLSSGYLHTGHSLFRRTSLVGVTGDIALDSFITEIVTTTVHFAALTRKEINAYVATGEPMQCAGGFALEGMGGMFVNGIEGCYSNVIGLSLPWLRKSLFDAGVEDLGL